VQAAALFRAVLAGSYLYDPGAARSIQDALSFRVLSQFFGPALEAFRVAAEEVETEINAAADNPLVLAEDGVMLSTPISTRRRSRSPSTRWRSPSPTSPPPASTAPRS
jgi:histidine ammonia-lyase